MRILVFSDVHGSPGAVDRVIACQPEAAAVLFLGDGLRGVEDRMRRYPDIPFYAVPGNCDWGATLPENREERLGGKRIFFTHGHLYQVKYGLDRLIDAARTRQADIALFGHTHEPLERYEDGLYLLNPGSLGYGHTYGFVDITPGGIMTGIASLDR